MRATTVLCIAAILISIQVFATSDPQYGDKKYEITFAERGSTPNLSLQANLRNQQFWQNFLIENGTWYVHFNENTAIPTRAYGKPISVAGESAEEKAWNFIQNQLADFNLPTEELVFNSISESKKYQYVIFKQIHNGLEVIGSRLTVKISQSGNVVLFGTEVYPSIEVESQSYQSLEALNQLIGSSLDFTIDEFNSDGNLSILPIPGINGLNYRPVYTIVAEGIDAGMPVKLFNLIDAVDGTIWYRTNQVKHSSNCSHHEHKKGTCTDTEEETDAESMMVVSGTVTGEVYPLNPYETTEILPIPNLGLNISGTTVYTDENGLFTSNATGPVSSNFNLSGRWCRIYSNGVTPTFSTNLSEGGDNNVSINSGSNVRERSAYWSTNQIHDYMKGLLPDFDGLDIQLTTNIDVAGECNAFYDGNSINFYVLGGGCYPTSLISDVVYHEYGHGINDKFYQSQGSFYNNGAMNEGYADFWALTLMESPLLGIGFYLDNEDPLRRYDINPKVYPINIVNEVHSDGEIICGAWYTTHQLLGDDWDLTRELFVEAFSGLQATAFNGQEGVAFTNVLIDALQGDDDDDDITNGTPNGDAIVEGFRRHGITLISNANLTHTPIEYAEQSTEIDLDLTLQLNFPFSQYLENPYLFWKTNPNDDWTAEAMGNVGGNDYAISLPPQPAGTIISYHVGAIDINDAVASVQPIGAREPDPNIPYFILVGFDLDKVHDNDTNEQFGNWDIGLNDDNATTGEWEQEFPVGSFSTPGDLSTVVAPYYEHTGGIDGELCMLTGVSSADDAPVGENDVDGGKTTLQTPEIDLSTYNDPAFTYWRWYTNSPSTGANPGADYWEVKISDDGGDSWTHVEATKTSDASWRRFAFKVADYVSLTDQVMLQFIASDSIRPGQYLEGGSLVEAALDDIYLYETQDVNNINERDISDAISIWPNPAQSNVTIDWVMSNDSPVSIDIFNVESKLVQTQELGNKPAGKHRYTLNIDDLAEGVYIIKMITDSDERIQRLFKVKN